jgi:hypothetical protein
MGSWHLPTAARTAAELLALQPSRLAIGHGRVLNEPAAAMEKALREAEARLDGKANQSDSYGHEAG